MSMPANRDSHAHAPVSLLTDFVRTGDRPAPPTARTRGRRWVLSGVMVRRVAVTRLIAGVATAAVMTACTSADQGSAGPTSGAPAGPTATSTAPSSTAVTPTAVTPTAGSSARAVAAPVPRADHVVVVVMENHSFSDLIGNPAAPFINHLARTGALFTRSYALTHPSEPNYLALFSGSTQGLTDDSCPHSYHGPNLARAVVAAGGTFAGYSDGLPRAGFTGCNVGSYARKHAPWVDFPDVPAAANRPFTAFPARFGALPTLSFVVPDLDHDMHDGTVAAGDHWLERHLGGYVSWARTHRSLLVLTWDEDDRSESNRIPTVVSGDGVRAGRYDERLTHYRLLRTLEAVLHIPPIGASAGTRPVTDIWSH